MNPVFDRSADDMDMFGQGDCHEGAQGRYHRVTPVGHQLPMRNSAPTMILGEKSVDPREKKVAWR
jgi:hypothetical protein